MGDELVEGYGIDLVLCHVCGLSKLCFSDTIHIYMYGTSTACSAELLVWSWSGVEDLDGYWLEWMFAILMMMAFPFSLIWSGEYFSAW